MGDPIDSKRHVMTSLWEGNDKRYNTRLVFIAGGHNNETYTCII